MNTTNIDVTADHVRNLAWNAWRAKYNDRYEAIMKKIVESGEKGLVSIEESIPVASFKYITTLLKKRNFVISYYDDIELHDGDDMESSDDIVITISWE